MIETHLVDNRDYNLADPGRYVSVPKEKIVALLKEATAVVSFDMEIEVEATSRKVIQVDHNNTVENFIYNQSDDKIKPLFRDVFSLEDTFWLYVSVRDKAQDVPFLYNSR